MTKLKLLPAIAILTVLALAPSLVEARSHHGRLYLLPYEISFKHNYGPGGLPGTFAYYDGPATAHCAQSAAAYLGQDRRRHPCN